jgi:hypothetical protein
MGMVAGRAFFLGGALDMLLFLLMENDETERQQKRRNRETMKKTKWMREQWHGKTVERTLVSFHKWYLLLHTDVYSFVLVLDVRSVVCRRMALCTTPTEDSTQTPSKNPRWKKFETSLESTHGERTESGIKGEKQ